jgi:hypothetical protein
MSQNKSIKLPLEKFDFRQGLMHHHVYWKVGGLSEDLKFHDHRSNKGMAQQTLSNCPSRTPRME